MEVRLATNSAEVLRLRPPFFYARRDSAGRPSLWKTDNDDLMYRHRDAGRSRASLARNVGRVVSNPSPQENIFSMAAAFNLSSAHSSAALLPQVIAPPVWYERYPVPE